MAECSSAISTIFEESTSTITTEVVSTISASGTPVTSTSIFETVISDETSSITSVIVTQGGGSTSLVTSTIESTIVTSSAISTVFEPCETTSTTSTSTSETTSSTSTSTTSSETTTSESTTSTTSTTSSTSSTPAPPTVITTTSIFTPSSDTSASTSSATRINSSSGSSSSNTGAIVGGVVGGVAGLIILILLIFCFKKRSDDKKAKEFDFSDNGAWDPSVGVASGVAGANGMSRNKTGGISTRKPAPRFSAYEMEESNSDFDTKRRRKMSPAQEQLNYYSSFNRLSQPAPPVPTERAAGGVAGVGSANLDAAAPPQRSQRPLSDEVYGGLQSQQSSPQSNTLYSDSQLPPRGYIPYGHPSSSQNQYGIDEYNTNNNSNNNSYASRNIPQAMPPPTEQLPYPPNLSNEDSNGWMSNGNKHGTLRVVNDDVGVVNLAGFGAGGNRTRPGQAL